MNAIFIVALLLASLTMNLASVWWALRYARMQERDRCRWLCLSVIQGEGRLSPSLRRVYRAVNDGTDRVLTEAQFFAEKDS